MNKTNGFETMAYQPKHYLRAVFEFETQAEMEAAKKKILEEHISGECILKDLSTYKE